MLSRLSDSATSRQRAGRIPRASWYYAAATVLAIACIQTHAAAQITEPPLPIILIHGLSDNAGLWREGSSFIDYLAVQYQWPIGSSGSSCVMTFDLAQGGQGRDGDTVNEVMTHSSLANCPLSTRVFRINFDPDWPAPSSRNPLGNCAAIYLQAKAVQVAIATVKQRTGASKVVLVGHSMGGLAALTYLVGDGDNNGVADYFGQDVSKIVTLGTPFEGAALASLSDFACGSLFTDAERDLLPLGSPLLPNIFLTGGSEAGVPAGYWDDVNANGFHGSTLGQLVGRPLPGGVEGFWIVGREHDLNDDDCVVSVESQRRLDGELKEIHARHTTAGPSCGEGCTEPMAHQIIIEALDEGDTKSNAWPIALSATANGFLTHAGDTAAQTTARDDDWFSANVAGLSLLHLRFAAGGIDVAELRLENQDGTILVPSRSVQANELVELDVPLTQATSEVYLHVQGWAEGYPSGLGDLLHDACDDVPFAAVDQPYEFRVTAGNATLSISATPTQVVRPGQTTLAVSVVGPDQQPVPTAQVRLLAPLPPGGYAGCSIDASGCVTSADANGMASIIYSPTADGVFTITAASLGGSASLELPVNSGGLTAAAAPSAVVVNQSTTLTATVSGVSPLGGRPVTFSTAHPGLFSGTGCTFGPCVVNTNASGVAQINYTPSASGTAQISVTTPDIPGTVVSLPVAPPSNNFTVTLAVLYQNGDSGSTTYEIEATIRTSEGQPIVGERVDWSTTRGSLSHAWSSTAPTGIAETDLSVTTAGSTTVTATVRGTQFATTFDAQIGQQPGGVMVPVRTLTVGTGEVFGVAWAASGQVLVAAEENGTIRAWDGATGNILWTATASDNDLGQVAVSPDGSRVLVGNSDGYDVFQASNGQLVATVDFTLSSDRVINAAMTSNTAFLRNNRTSLFTHASLSTQGSSAYTIPAADDTFDFSGHMAHSQQRGWVAATNSEGVIFINSTGGSLVRREDMGSGSAARGAGDTDFDATSARLAATAYNTIRVYDLASPTWAYTTLTAPVLGNNEKLAVSFIDNDSKLAVGGAGKVAVLSLPGGTTFRSGDVPGWAWEADWSAPRQELAVGASGGQVAVFRPLDPVDVTPPTINVTTPVEGLITFATSITTTGQVSDASAITEFSINSTPVALGSGGAFSHTVGLSAGSNTVSYFARDAAQNPTQLTRSVTRLIDTTAPIIGNAGVAPSSGVAGTMFTIIASVVDGDTGVASVTAMIKNGGGSTVASLPMSGGPTYSASFNSGASAVGFYTVDIAAVDSSPQANSRVVTGATSLEVEPPPSLSVSPASFSFGQVYLGDHADAIFTVTNSGGGTLTGNASVAAPFAVVSGTPYALGRGQSTQVLVRFTPIQTGPASGIVAFTGASGATRGVSGTGAQQPGVLDVDPTALDYGIVDIDTCSPLAVTASNIGSGPLTASVFADPPFGVTLGAAIDLAPGASTQVEISFCPTEHGVRTAVALFIGGGGASVDLTGFGFDRFIFADGFESGDLGAWSGSVGGPAPVLAVTPVSHDFGSVEIGQALDLPFTVQNTGAGMLSGTATTTIPFSVTSGSPYSLGAGASTQVSVRFAPSASGPVNRDVTFTGGAGATRGLIGSGYVVPTIDIDPTNLDFGSVAVGAYADLTFAVSNIGGGTLTGSATTETPFSIVEGSPYSIPDGGSTQVTVRFSPEAEGPFIDTVSFSGGGEADGGVLGVGAATGLVGYWPFDTDSNDHSGHNNVGAWSGGGTLVAGRFGSAASFVQGQHYTIPNSTTLRTFTALTVSAWFKPTEPPNSSGGEDLFGGGLDGEESRYTLTIVPPSGVTFGAYNTNLVPSQMPSAYAIPNFLGQWHHLASVWDGSVVRVYVDGAQVLSGTFSGTISVPPTSPLFVNRHDWWGGSGTSSRLTGQIDDLAIFDRALSPAEVLALSSDSNSNGVADFWDAAPPPTVTSSFYHFDEGSGTVATDAIGGHTGTVSGATWVTGHSGTALSFGSPATSAVAVPRSVLNNLGNSVFAEAWIYPTARSVAPDSASIFTKRGAYNDWSFTVDPTGHVCSGLSGAGGINGIGTGACSTTTVPLNQWTKVATSYDGTTMRIYVNGVVDASATQALVLDWAAPTCPGDQYYTNGCLYGIWIGATSTYSRTQVAPNSGFKGIIDELRIGPVGP